jgi:hypothetical protein
VLSAGWVLLLMFFDEAANTILLWAEVDLLKDNCNDKLFFFSRQRGFNIE